MEMSMQIRCEPVEEEPSSDLTASSKEVPGGEEEEAQTLNLHNVNIMTKMIVPTEESGEFVHVTVKNDADSEEGSTSSIEIDNESDEDFEEQEVRQLVRPRANRTRLNSDEFKDELIVDNHLCPHVTVDVVDAAVLAMFSPSPRCAFKGCKNMAEVACANAQCIGNPEVYRCSINDHSIIRHFAVERHYCTVVLNVQLLYCVECNIVYTLEKIIRAFIDRRWSLQISEETLRNFSVVGLFNNGNTCFMNAVFQILIHSQLFSDCFIKMKKLQYKNSSAPPITEQIISLIETMKLKDDRKAINPILLQRSIQSVYPHYNSRQQQDALEFMRNLLTALDEETKVPVDFLHLKFLSGENDANIETSEMLDELVRLWKSNKPISDNLKDAAFHRSITTDLFQGTLQNDIICSECGECSTNSEKFLEISLPIPGTEEGGEDTHVEQIEDCLGKFFELNVLDFENRYYCDNCESLVRAEKITKITHLPNLLCIGLKRFCMENNEPRKVDTLITFPFENFTLEKYTSVYGTNESYDLIGIIEHRGDYQNGHYVTYAFEKNLNLWFEFDDTETRVLERRDMNGKQPYVLLYSKNGAEKMTEYICGDFKNKPKQCYINKEWKDQFLENVNCGPITNKDVICKKHKKILNLDSEINTFLTKIDYATWYLLQNHAGGGPLITDATICEECDPADDADEEDDDSVVNNTVEQISTAYNFNQYPVVANVFLTEESDDENDAGILNKPLECLLQNNNNGTAETLMNSLTMRYYRNLHK